VLDLEHGRCLARQQRPGPAAEALRAARGIFARLRAQPFLVAADAELASLGERRTADGGPGLPGSPGLPGLSAQELRVARLVASGLSNREAAAQLYLSPKTVEYHLSHAFAKLGVRTRHQLTARIGPGDNPGVPA
jgi:DNA-binding CsgD family transcriptional regulator